MSDDKPVEVTAREQPPRQRWRDRLWGLRTVIAVALASLLIGALGGAAVAGLGGHHDDRTGPGFGHEARGGPGHGRGPRGFVPPGQLKKKDRGREHGPGRDDRGGREDEGNS